MTHLTLPQVSVICPMYNEGDHIQENVNKLRTVLEQLKKSWEIVLVDDGSTDNSLETAIKAFSADSRIRCLGYSPNRGRGFALRTGMKATQGQFVITTEADLTWGENIIADLLKPLEENPQVDVVVGSPYMPGGRMENVPFFRLWVSKLGNKILRYLLPGNLYTSTGMTRAYRQHVLQTLDLESDDKEIHLEIINKITSLGFQIQEIPATVRWKTIRKKRKTSFQIKKTTFSHLVIGSGEFPFVLFGSLSLSLLITGIGIGIYLLILSLQGTPQSGRPLVIFSILLILTGLQVLFACFIANQSRDLRRQIYRLHGDVLRLRKEIDDEKN